MRYWPVKQGSAGTLTGETSKPSHGFKANLKRVFKLSAMVVLVEI